MNKTLMARAISKRNGPPRPESSKSKTEESLLTVTAAAPKEVVPSAEMQKELFAAKSFSDKGDHEMAVNAYRGFMKTYGNESQMRDPKLRGNVLLLFGKAALAMNDIELAVKCLDEAGKLIPQNPQVWRSLVACHECTENKGCLQAALAKSIEVAESKGNYSKSRPMRIKLAEIQETLGDNGGALMTLKKFITNGKAVASPAEDGLSNAEDLNELMRLRCAALTRGQSGNAVSLNSPSSEKTEKEICSENSNRNLDKSQNGSDNASCILASNASPPKSNRGMGRDRFGSPESIRSGSTETSVSTIVGKSRGANEVPVAGWILLAAAQPMQRPEDIQSMEDSERMSRLSILLKMLSEDHSSEGRRKAAVALAEAIAASQAEAHWVESNVSQFLSDENSAVAREGALWALQAQCQLARYVSEPYWTSFFPLILSAYADVSSNVRHAAVDAGNALIRALNPSATRMVLPHIIDGVRSREWRIKIGALEMLSVLASRAPLQISAALPELIPPISLQVWDTHRLVQSSSKNTLLAICACISNPDIEPAVEQLVGVIAKPEEAHSALDTLMATTFVTRVTGATLSVIAPLLGKCLRERNAQMRRKASKVISNMCKLVLDPKDLAPFVPILLPALQKVVAETADPEANEVAKEALSTLTRAVGGSHAAIKASQGIAGPSSEEVTALRTEMLGSLEKAVLKCMDAGAGSSDESVTNQKLSVDEAALYYIAGICTSVILHGSQEKDQVDESAWSEAVLPYLSAYTSEDKAREIFSEFFKMAVAVVQEGNSELNSNDVCNIEFSLAYGGKILLRNTRLHLKEGHKYGLIGANGAGKTTLMRNIANRNIDSLPDTLRTVFVEHDILGSESESSALEFVVSVLNSKDRESEAINSLKEIGFTDAMIESPVLSLSGGWKMKLALVRAMLMNANVLLLDEPTNHLDTNAVSWLTKYLSDLKEVTVLVVSHDTKFLDDIVTDILHYENQKLVPYHGNLTHFVKLRPEAKSYYELEASNLRFKFPNPGPLDGINSTTKSILTLQNVNYSYSGASKTTLSNVSLKLCLASRVAVVGANGAGKTTLIRLIVREREPDSGTVWAHHNLRVAYVAQHSFHHVELHLEKSPVEYMQWRYGTGDGTDREAKENSTALVLTDEEKERFSRTGAVESIYGRRKTGRTLEYECSFVDMGPEFNRYVTLEELIQKGFQKLVQQADNRIAAQAAGLDSRPVTTKEIRQHLDDFALAPEFSVHGKIGGLSGGQKVKLVLAAAMWNRPHLLVLDEPTNYLDREALGALTLGLQDFGGGVIMISHNQEFLSAICTESWLIQNGKLLTKGEAKETSLKTFSKIRDTEEPEEEMTTAGCTNATVTYDNLINPKTLKFLSKKEIRKLSKLAEKANVPLPQYVAGLTRASPEWKWL